ncbi:UDP-N-acetylglucosamine diphosphorylase [Piptocephalis cylindrospora]|uniref:UDP-N-acetylglucosamine diphosphorylase n=1 Tax=Piptocephalis cylindrospora TaxID=1907219 RepID=A0A4P9Y7E1_9FUNG|nr:UDP-N-acetylglucosamine diphosphorylase [Piptocephalis cylindrospora]|eukprot:RKP15047.1 UDP-N-acetylglucosamine diphosphorylase [Piptocephalis cylindrospora]
MTSGGYESLVGKLLSANQGHLVMFWNKLSPEEQEKLVSQLRAMDLDRINGIFKLATTTKTPPASTVTPLPEEVIGSTIDGTPEQKATWEAKGFELVAANQVAVVLMAGGQGTRLGSAAPKGCYDIGLPSHKSLFALQADRIRRVQILAAAKAGKAPEEVTIPWYVMTSAPTRAATEAHFKENNYFGLEPSSVFFFNQGTLPCFDPSGKIFLSDPSTLTASPDGNGGIYAALSSEGVLEDMAKRGIEHIHSYCVDNCLVRVADPTFVGYCALQGAECGAKVVRKTEPAEPVGVLCKREGKYSVVEYSEIDKEMSEQRREGSDKLVYGAANIANHYYTRAFLERVPEFESSLAYHVASKKIPHVDITTGEAVKPTSPNGVKLELFVFDVFPHTEKLAVLEVERAEEFAPLKNAPGTGVDCPETSKEALLAQQRRWLQAAGVSSIEGDVELSSLTSYQGEGLEAFAGQALQGPKVL